MEDRSEPRHYEIRVRGALGEALVAAFPELVARRRHGDTIFVGGIPDQAALHGVIGRIESLGLELLEVRPARPRLKRSGPDTRELGR